MPLWMAAADIVVSRAGAMTISELALMNKAAILIPSPNVVDNHQFKNAKVLSDAGAAVLIEEHNISNGVFSGAVLDVLNNDKKRNALCANISAFADAEVNDRIYDEIIKLIVQKLIYLFIYFLLYVIQLHLKKFQKIMNS